MATTVNGDNCVGLMQGTLVLPLPRYPSSVVTDASLKIAANQVQSTLTMRVSSLDTIFRVSDTSRLVVDMLLTIDSEIVSVSAIDAASHTITVVRGFDGTVATSHNAGRLLQAFIDAWHHNALAAEVKAIETALGPNLSNVSGAGGAQEYVVTTPYNFPAQSPGGTLNGGVVNSITLTPVPAGVNGTDVGHYLYISGGTGAAEPVLITGGTALSGAPSGTIFFTPVNNHSGAWSIRSATAGIQEAITAQTAVQYICITVPAGQHSIYGTINFPPAKGGVTLQGAGGYSTKLLIATPNIDVIKVPAGVYYPSILNLEITGDKSYTTGWAITLGGCANPVVQDIRIQFLPNGVKVLNCTQTSITRVEVREPRVATGVGFYIDLGGYELINMTGVQVVGNGGSKHLSGMDVYNASSLKVSMSEFMQSTYAVRLIPGAGQGTTSIDFVSVDFDNAATHGLVIQPTGGGFAERIRMVNVWACSSGTGNGIMMNGGAGLIQDVSISNSKFFFNGDSGIAAAIVMDLNISGNAIYANDVGITVFGAITGLLIENNVIGTQRAGLPPQRYGVFLPAVATENYAIIGNKIVASTISAIQDASTGMNRIIKDNIPGNTSIIDVASAGTVSLGFSGNCYRLSGTTAITRMTEGWANREVRLIKSDAGSITFNTGGGSGGIAGTATLAQGGVLACIYDATAGLWYLK